MQIQEKNEVKVTKLAGDGTYYVTVDGEHAHVDWSVQNVITWLEFNWPAGTKVVWDITA